MSNELGQTFFSLVYSNLVDKIIITCLTKRYFGWIKISNMECLPRHIDPWIFTILITNYVARNIFEWALANEVGNARAIIPACFSFHP